jgi:CheY-like chemotaxis protein
MENPKIRIVVIEDNSDDEALLLRQLSKAGLDRHVKIFRDGNEAINCFKTEPSLPDDLIALFLDLKLPSIDGLRVLEFIRQAERTRKVPVVVMTSSNSQSDLERCQELGVTGFVSKPVTVEAFGKVIADNFHNGFGTNRANVASPLGAG